MITHCSSTKKQLPLAFELSVPSIENPDHQAPRKLIKSYFTQQPLFKRIEYDYEETYDDHVLKKKKKNEIVIVNLEYGNGMHEVRIADEN